MMRSVWQAHLLALAGVLYVLLAAPSAARSEDIESVITQFNESYEAGRFDEAERASKRLLELLEKAWGRTDPLYATGLTKLAQVYIAQGRYAEALRTGEQALSIQEKALGRELLIASGIEETPD